MYSRVLLQRCYLSVVNILVVLVVQISGDTECMIVQMLYLDSIPLALVNFLKDPRIMLHGVGISGDAKKLEKDWGLKIQGAVDLGTLASTTRGQQELKNAGLKTLAKVVIDFDMDKPKRVTMSNWAKCELDRIQVEYASLDAWVAYAIHRELVKCKNLSMGTWWIQLPRSCFCFFNRYLCQIGALRWTCLIRLLKSLSDTYICVVWLGVNPRACTKKASCVQ